mmetsp:Transcript_2354/g.3912  ORF Transcript_2354/g.3912 Transcript_2354/m.3912 type:complete len:337 (-) Transcript_2354:688-1698(-)|eukprot:CAMPEP_0119103620 /NCGR_PEP_ID=MMETSP1180-20130426/2025_1 /TAXON_ID=3052 ORGANISM="Chlamydomonas cf sp, Strain CCMP681" /NCGR_SAMPLE_ID=MMETSP1180 /ASSEMBLY_ACC=CAM_ASM_000741 /LENGTH=336 /DNA_ID=CAMNT_0007088175 /DNA_START=224 /DNA_END=1234 /DNA_ORIENTATION=-
MSFSMFSSSTAVPKLQTAQEAFWYLPEHLTEQQKNHLAGFKMALGAAGILGQDGYGVRAPDTTLLRFLKARQWNEEKALHMYLHMMKWREENKIDELYETMDYPQLKALVPHYPHFYHKQDKFGRPVYIELLGVTDCARMLEVSPQDLILQYHCWTWERLEKQLMPAQSSVVGHPIITSTVILDLAGMTLKSFTRTTQKLLTTIAKIDQDYYPEHLGTMFIINTPFIFKAIWAVVNPMLEERTRRKIIVLGADYQATLLQLIPAENLPVMFGGLSVCPDHVNSIGAWMSQPPCNTSSWFPLGPESHLVDKEGKEGSPKQEADVVLVTQLDPQPENS